MSEKYAFWVTLRPQSDRCGQGEAEVRLLDFKTTWSEFHYLPGVDPKQLCALAHLARMYLQSGYFLVKTRDSKVRYENNSVGDLFCTFAF